MNMTQISVVVYLSLLLFLRVHQKNHIRGGYFLVAIVTYFVSCLLNFDNDCEKSTFVATTWKRINDLVCKSPSY